MFRIGRSTLANARVRSAQVDGSVAPPPVWVSRSRRILTVTEGEPIDVSIAAASSGLVTYEVVQGELPGVTALNALTGRISGTAPALPQTTEYFFVVEARSPLGAVARASFSVLVVAVNDAPVWVTPSDLGTIAEDEITYARNFSLVDDGGVEAVFLQDGAFPEGSRYNAQNWSLLGRVPGLVGEDAVRTFTMRGVDAGGRFADRTFTLTFANVNIEPQIVTAPQGDVLFDATAGNSVEVQFDAADDEPVDRLSWSISHVPPGLSFSASGRLAGLIPPVALDELHSFAVTVVDRQGLSASQDYTVRYSRPNSAPVWQTQPSLGTFAENAALLVTLVATDDFRLAGVRLHPESPPLPSGVGLRADGVLSGSLPTVVGVRAQHHTFAAVAVDDRGLTALRTFVFSVENILRPPIWITPPGNLGSFGRAVVVAEPLAFEDDEAGASYSLVAGSLPAFLALTPFGIEGTVPLDLAVDSVSEITLRITDRDGLSAERVFSLSTGPSHDRAPVWLTEPGLGALAPGETATIPLAFYDDAPGCVASFMEPLAFGSLAPSGTLALTAPTLAATYVFSVALLDVTGLTAARTFALVVAAAAGSLAPPVGETPANPIFLGRADEGTPGLSYGVWDLPARPPSLELGGDVPPGFGVLGRAGVGGDLGRIVPEVEGESRTFVFDVTGSLAGQPAITRHFALAVDGVANTPPTWVTEPTLPPLFEGERFSVALEGADDEPGLTYAFVGSNNLPPLSALTDDGVLTGSLGAVPSAGGTLTFAAVITDAVGATSPVRTFLIPTVSTTDGPDWITPENAVLGTFSGLHRFARAAAPTITARRAVSYAGSVAPNLTVGRFGALEGRMPDLRQPATLTFAATATDALGQVTPPRTFQIGLVPRTNAPPQFVAEGMIASVVTNPNLPASEFRRVIAVLDDDFEEPPTGSFVSGALPAGLTFEPETISVRGTLAAWTASPSTIFTFSVAAIDSDGAATAGTFAIQIRRFDAPPSFSFTGPLATFYPGSLVQVPLPAVDDYGPLTFAPFGDTFPPGFTLTSSGVFRGVTPPVPPGVNTATIPFQASVRDGSGGFVSGGFSIVVQRDDQVPVWQTETLPAVDERMPYGATLVATDDSGPVEFAVFAGALPETLVLTTDGLLVGSAPSVVNDTTFRFTVRAFDRFDNFADRAFALLVRAVNEPPEWLTPGGSVGTFAGFSFGAFTFVASDAGAVSYARTGGALPDGMTLNAATGVLSGTLAQVPTAATVFFRIRATDPQGLFSERDFAATVLRGNEPPVWVTDAGTIGAFVEQTPFTFRFSATDMGGAVARYTIAPPALNLPAGFTLSAGGVLTGAVPDIAADTTYSLPLRVLDAEGAFADRVFAVRGLAAPVFRTPAGSLGGFVEGNPVNFAILVEAQPPVVGFAVASGSLPPGLALDRQTGAVSGTIEGLSADQTFAFTVRALTASGVTADRAFSMDVEAVVSDPNTNFLFHFDGNLDDATRRSTASNIDGTALPLIYLPGAAGFGQALQLGRVQIPNNNAWNFTGDWTLEQFVLSTAEFPVPFSLVDAASGRSVFFARRSNTFAQQARRSGWRWNVASGVSGSNLVYAESEIAYAPRNQWHHVAVQSDGGNVRFFSDGIPVAVAPLSPFATARLSGAFFNVGRPDAVVGVGAGGIVDEFRFSRVARYPAPDAFAPPVAPLRSLPDAAGSRTILHVPLDTATGFLDIALGASVASAETTIDPDAGPFAGVGSARFTASGSGTGLSFPATPAFLARADQSGVNIEFWLRLDTAPVGGAIASLFCNALSNTTETGYHFYLLSTRLVSFSMRGRPAASERIFGTTIPLNTWTHVVLQKTGWYAAVYLNGNLAGRSLINSSSPNDFYPGAGTIFVGTSNGTADRLAGRMSDLRVTLGGRYPFIPPTAPFGE